MGLRIKYTQRRRRVRVPGVVAIWTILVYAVRLQFPAGTWYSLVKAFQEWRAPMVRSIIKGGPLLGQVKGGRTYLLAS